MTATELIARRLHNQRLVKTSFRRPEEVVAWLGAVQAQDYIGAKWAVGLRGAFSDAGVERAFDEGRVLRTHVLRPTWHFVAPADIRWMLALTAPRVHGFSAYHYRLQELDHKVFARCHKVIARTLEGGRHLTRAEVAAALRKAGVACDNLRLGLIVMQAELSGLICSGARRGKQHTYALIDERVPPAAELSREEALAELTRRYVASHGPVTVRDFSWWSGLSMADAKKGLASIASELEHVSIDDGVYWSSAGQTTRAPARGRRTRPTAWLMPNYDEYFIAYKDRAVVLGEPKQEPGLGARPEFAHLLCIDGRLRGTWKRSATTRAAGVELRTFGPLTKPERTAVDDAVSRYADFLELPATLTIV